MLVLITDITRAITVEIITLRAWYVRTQKTSSPRIRWCHRDKPCPLHIHRTGYLRESQSQVILCLVLQNVPDFSELVQRHIIIQLHIHIYIYILYIILLGMAEFRQLTNLKSDLFPSEIKPFGDDFHYQPKSTAKWHHCQAVMIQPKWMCAKYWESNLRGMPLIAILEIVNSYSAAQWLHMCIRDEIFQLHSSKDHNNIWLIINH